MAMVVEGGSSSSDGPATTLESGEPSSATKQPDAPPTHFPWGIFIFCWLGWCFDFLDLGTCVRINNCNTQVSRFYYGGVCCASHPPSLPPSVMF